MSGTINGFKWKFPNRARWCVDLRAQGKIAYKDVPVAWANDYDFSGGVITVHFQRDVDRLARLDGGQFVLALASRREDEADVRVKTIQNVFTVEPLRNVRECSLEVRVLSKVTT